MFAAQRVELWVSLSVDFPFILVLQHGTLVLRRFGIWSAFCCNGLKYGDGLRRVLGPRFANCLNYIIYMIYMLLLIASVQSKDILCWKWSTNTTHVHQKVLLAWTISQMVGSVNSKSFFRPADVDDHPQQTSVCSSNQWILSCLTWKTVRPSWRPFVGELASDIRRQVSPLNQWDAISFFLMLLVSALDTTSSQNQCQDQHVQPENMM